MTVIERKYMLWVCPDCAVERRGDGECGACGKTNCVVPVTVVPEHQLAGAVGAPDSLIVAVNSARMCVETFNADNGDDDLLACALAELDQAVAILKARAKAEVRA